MGTPDEPAVESPDGGICRLRPAKLAVAVEEFRQRFGNQCSLAPAIRAHHGRDESPLDVSPPDLVVYAESGLDVAGAVRIAARHSLPVIAFGAGSSLEGHVLAVEGGMCLDLSRLNRVMR